MTDQDTIHLTVPLGAVNVILAALGKQPAENVLGVILMVRDQAQAQVNEADKTTASMAPASVKVPGESPELPPPPAVQSEPTPALQD